MGTPMGLPPADGCSSSRALKLCICVHHCIPRVWGLLIWTFQKKIDSLPAVLYSTLRGKTDKLEEAVNRELNVTRS